MKDSLRISWIFTGNAFAGVSFICAMARADRQRGQTGKTWTDICWP